MTRLIGIVAVLLAASQFGCNLLKRPEPKPFEARVKVFGDPGTPLKGADVWYKQKKVGVTDDAGLVNFRLKGAEGEVYDLTVKCPTGYQSPAKPVSVVLRNTSDPAQRPEYQVDCPKSSRAVVVAVRADSGPNLAVMYLGREVARTDVSGAAHVFLEVPPNQVFQLAISTDTDGAKDLRPQSPTATFEVKQADDVFVFDQKFKVERKKVRGGRAKPKGPTPL
jgi:hypothetical protein